MEFKLEDGYIIKIYKDEKEQTLISELYNDEGEFLERTRLSTDDMCEMFF